MSLAEAAAEADELAQSGAERELAVLRQQWDEELESAARSADYRQRAVAYRAIGQFRFRQKLELLRRGLEDESPAARGSALLSVQLLSKDSPGVVNAIRPLLASAHGLHTMATIPLVRCAQALPAASRPARTARSAAAPPRS